MGNFKTDSEIEALNEVDLVAEIKSIKELLFYNEFASNQDKLEHEAYWQKLNNRLKTLRKTQLKERLSVGRHVVAQDNTIPHNGRKLGPPDIIGELTEDDLRQILEASKDLEKHDPQVKHSLQAILTRREQELDALAIQNNHAEGPQGDLLNQGHYNAERRRLSRPAHNQAWTENETERQHYGSQRNRKPLRESMVLFLFL
ncbi:hypothetical protein N7U66_01775 [Lacinutrix neustonica]|uniref:Uncharacterized protein n=1 Tax=Lacinutrix neustonica TaxID=2980107 RepID=A0A9E8SH91_9FLAO|nr:hypothetical protein [Lacinutrix neustonica]WAC02465.1 hypothetical protein N7U66_01775 [Lacinutrix neustonica]